MQATSFNNPASLCNPASLWRHYVGRDITQDEMLQAILTRDVAWDRFKSWVLTNGLAEEENPHRLIGTLDVMAEKLKSSNPTACSNLEQLAQQVREAAFTFSQLPKEIAEMIGMKTSVKSARSLQIASKALHELGLRMTLRSQEQASKILQNLLYHTLSRQPEKTARVVPVLEKWINAIPNNWKKVKVKVTSYTPQKTLQMLHERFAEYLLFDFAHMQLEGKSSDKVVLELNTLFAEIPNIRSLLFRWQGLPPDAIPRIHWPKNLQTVTFQNVNNAAQFLGSLPASIRTVDCFECQLTDADLARFARFTSLQELNLTENGAIQGLGTSLDSLPPSLVKLSFAKCNLTDAALSHFTRLTKLEELNLWQNKAIHGGGNTLDSLPTTLKILDLSHTGLTDTALSHFTRLNKLEELRLLCCEIQGGGNTLDFLPLTLKKLDFSFCKLTDAALGHFARLTNLQVLEICGNPIRGQGLSLDSLPPSLVELDCRWCKLTDEALPHLTRLTHLRKLGLAKNPITGKALSSLPLSLVEIDCSYCHLQDQDITHFARLKKLERLHLQATNIREGTTLRTLPPSLLILNLQDCSIFISPENLAHLRQRRDPPQIWGVR